MPLGVPVRMMSPGSIVMFVDTKLTMLKQLKISWLVLLFWRSWPFWKSCMLRSWGSIFASM